MTPCRIIQGREEHLDRMCQIADEAKAQLKHMGIDQWQCGYPCRSDWELDIATGRAYLASDDMGHVIGQCAYQNFPEPSYEHIDGSWKSQAPYACIHRVCVSKDSKGRGVAGALFAFLFEKARSDGFSSVRIDTHEDNAPMRRALEKSGFSYCGVIALCGGPEDGHLRYAFEKMLGPRNEAAGQRQPS